MPIFHAENPVVSITMWLDIEKVEPNEIFTPMSVLPQSNRRPVEQPKNVSTEKVYVPPMPGVFTSSDMISQ